MLEILPRSLRINAAYIFTVYSEFFWTKVKRFSEFDFTGKFWVFKLKMPFRLLGGQKKVTRHFFCPKNGERSRTCHGVICGADKDGWSFLASSFAQGYGGQVASKDGVTFILRFAYTAANNRFYALKIRNIFDSWRSWNSSSNLLLTVRHYFFIKSITWSAICFMPLTEGCRLCLSMFLRSMQGTL